MYESICYILCGVFKFLLFCNATANVRYKYKDVCVCHDLN